MVRPTSAAAPIIERVLVADFTDYTSDAALGEVIAHAMTLELARSPVVNVVRREALTDVLRLMRAEPDAALTPELARALATREGMKVVIQGEVRTIGDGILLGAAVVSTVSGEVLHGASEVARDSTEILDAILRLSGEVRNYLGESLSSIESTQREWKFTTRSLEALRKQRAAWEASFRGDPSRAVQLIEDALAIDPEFVWAHLDLMALYQGTGSPRGAALPYLKRAFELRYQVSDYERYAIEGQYYSAITGDLPKAIAGYRAHVDVARQRGITAAWYGAFASALVRSGDLTGAEAILQEARREFRTPASQGWLVEVLYALGKPQEAERALEEIEQNHSGHPVAFEARMHMLLAKERYDQAHQIAETVRSGINVVEALFTQGEADALRGRVGESRSHWQELLHEATSNDMTPIALQAGAALGRSRLYTRSRHETFELDSLLAGGALDSLEFVSRPYLEIALYYGQSGAADRARPWLSAYEREYPPAYRGVDRWLLHRAKAAVLRAEGNPAAALDEFQKALRGAPARDGWFDGTYALQNMPELARIYDDLGVADSAIAVFERYLRDPSLLRVISDPFELVPVLERVAALHEQRGDRITAAARYRRVAELWRDADPELQPRVENARRRAVLLESR
jgi:tetratricopeptide (TPR) repeat protein